MRRELYDRRIAVYRGVVGVLSSIMTLGKVRGDDLATWAQATAEKGFLLDKGLSDYLESIRRRMVEVWAFDRSLSEAANLPSLADKRAALAGKQGDAMLWLAEQLPDLQERFAKYLRIA